MDMGQQPTQETGTGYDHVSVREVMEDDPKPEGEEGEAAAVRFSLIVWCSFAVVLQIKSVSSCCR